MTDPRRKSKPFKPPEAVGMGEECRNFLRGVLTLRYDDNRRDEAGALAALLGEDSPGAGRP